MYTVHYEPILFITLLKVRPKKSDQSKPLVIVTPQDLTQEVYDEIRQAANLREDPIKTNHVVYVTGKNFQNFVGKF